MKTTWLSAFVLASSMPLLAQQSTPTPVPPQLPAAEPPPTLNPPPAPGASSGSTTTLSGCIAGGNGGAFTMTNPTVLAGAGAIAPPSPLSGSTTNQAATSPANRPADPSSTPPGAVGTSGTIAGGSGSGDRSSGAAGTPGSGVTTGTVGVQGAANSGIPATPPIANVTPDAGVLSTANSGHGYRLTGTNLDAWLGQPVRVVGTVIAPSAPRTPAGTAAASSTLPEFRVQSVQATDGRCP